MSRKILLAAAVVALAVTGAWYSFLWKPATSQLHHARLAAATSRSSLESLQFRARALESEQRRIPAEERKLAGLEVSVPRTPSVPPLLRQLAAIERATGVTVASETQTLVAASTTPGSTPAASGTATTPTGSAAPATPALQQLQLSLTVSGDYRHLMLFLARVGRLPRSTVVQTVDIATGSATGGTGGLTATVTALTFYDTSPLPPAPRVP